MRIRWRACRADDYIAKPFSLEELKARVASHLRRWRRYHKQDVIEEHTAYANGLTIDWQRQIVCVYQQEIALTQKEFALVRLLAKNPSQTFTKEELYQHIWQQATLEDTHTVTVHIKALREKLKDSVKTQILFKPCGVRATVLLVNHYENKSVVTNHVFIVMVLPIVGAYSLYVWINAYYQDKNVAEYFDKWTELNQVKDVVDNQCFIKKCRF